MSSIAMTARDWYGLLDQGFRIEIAPPVKFIPSRRKSDGIAYGQASRLAVQFLDTPHGMQVDEFALKHGFPQEKLAKAVKNLREARRYGYRRRHKSQRRPGSDYGLMRQRAARFLDTPHGLTRDQFAAREGVPLESLSQAIRKLRAQRAGKKWAT